jgi:hypothetical protein
LSSAGGDLPKVERSGLVKKRGVVRKRKAQTPHTHLVKDVAFNKQRDRDYNDGTRGLGLPGGAPVLECHLDWDLLRLGGALLSMP